MEMKQKKKFRFSWSKVLFGFLFVVLIVYCLSLLLPVFWMIWSSFKDVVDFYLNAFGLPDKWFFTNYADTLDLLKVTVNTSKGKMSYGMAEMLLYSFTYSFGTSFLSVLWPMVTAYIVSRYDFKGKHFLYALNLFVMTVPIVGTLPASLHFNKMIGRYNNLPMYILLYGGPFGFTFILFYGAFKSIPKSYSEAAFMDGAGHFTVMLRIMFPMMMPTFVANLVLAFIGHWNDYQTIITWLPSYPNLAYGMYIFQAESARYGVGMPHVLSGFVIVAIPTSIIWIFSQKLITSKMMVGGLKE